MLATPQISAEQQRQRPVFENTQLLKRWPWLTRIVALAVVAVLFGALNPASFFSLQNLTSILDQATVPLIIAMGATLVIVMGSIDLSIEGTMATCALCFVLLSADSSNATDVGLFAFPLVLLVGVAFGIANGVIHTQLRIPSFMVSLGLWFMGLGIATVLFGDAMPILSTSTARGWASWKTLGLTNAVWVAAFMVLLSYYLSGWTKLGRFAYAIGYSEPISLLNAIPVTRYKIYVFTFAGFCTAVAALITTDRLGVGAIDAGNGQLFFTIAAVVVGGTLLSGGKGGIWNSVCGVFFLVIVNNGMILSGVPPVLQQAFSGLVIILAVVVAAYRHVSKLKVVK